MKREAKIEVYPGFVVGGVAAGKWYWRCRAANGRVVFDGSESYDSKSNVKRAIARLKDAGVVARDLKVVEL